MAERGSPGEATIYRDGAGRWHGWIAVGVKSNGKRDRRHRTGKTRAEVVKKIRDLEVKRETGGVPTVGAETVSAWLEHLGHQHRCSSRARTDARELRVDDPYPHLARHRRAPPRQAAA
jgi:hypothetical protein